MERPMEKWSRQAERELEQASKALEDTFLSAGVEKHALDRAWEGEFFPYGALGDEDKSLTDDQNSALYWAHEHDAQRRKIRELVFRIGDASQRRVIIEAVGRWEDAHSTVLRARESDAQHELRSAKERATSGAWGPAAAVAGVGVALGYALFALPGAIGGAVVGYFWGQKIVSEAKAKADAEVESCASAVAAAEESLQEERITPRFFNVHEQLTGEVDRDFGRESAVGNTYQFFRRGATDRTG